MKNALSRYKGNRKREEKKETQKGRSVMRFKKRNDEQGNRIIDPVTKKYKLGKSIKTTDWDERERVEEWRKGWADMCNRYLLMLGISHMLLTEKSYARQGSNQIPTIHLGAKACAMEKRGIPTLKGKMNMKIRMQNRTKVNEKIDHLKDQDKNIERMRG